MMADSQFPINVHENKKISGTLTVNTSVWSMLSTDHRADGTDILLASSWKRVQGVSL